MSDPPENRRIREDGLAWMPTYYIMDPDQDMAQRVAREMPSPEVIAACTWLTHAELRVYIGEYERVGFHGGLQWYRCRTGIGTANRQVFQGLTIEVPSLFIPGASDWDLFQAPGARKPVSARTRKAAMY